MYTLQPLSWRGMKTIKAALRELLRDDLTSIIQANLPDTLMQNLLLRASERIDELTPVFVVECLTPGTRVDVEEIEGLPAIELLTLREAAADVTDLNEVIGLEKKHMVALMSAAMELVETLTAPEETPPPGGQNLNITLPDITDGAKETSTD